MNQTSTLTKCALQVPFCNTLKDCPVGESLCDGIASRKYLRCPVALWFLSWCLLRVQSNLDLRVGIFQKRVVGVAGMLHLYAIVRSTIYYTPSVGIHRQSILLVSTMISFSPIAIKLQAIAKDEQWHVIRWFLMCRNLQSCLFWILQSCQSQETITAFFGQFAGVAFATCPSQRILFEARKLQKVLKRGIPDTLLSHTMEQISQLKKKKGSKERNI